MKTQNFVHLHLHTVYSIRESICRIPDVIQAAQAAQMPAIAITDHHNLYGAIEFAKTATAQGIQPIIGCEIDITAGTLPHPLVLLAKDTIGYQNLVQLVTQAQLTSGTQPQIKKEQLAQHSRGLIGLTGCLQGEIPSLITRGQLAQAQAALDAYRQLFAPGDFYLELQDRRRTLQHEVSHRVNCQLVEWAKEFQLPLVATNDVRYVKPQDWEAYACLRGMPDSQQQRPRLEPGQLYLRTPEEMQALFADLPEALQNTLEVADKCRFKFEFGRWQLPVYHPPGNIQPEHYLRQLVASGLAERYGSNLSPAILQRVEHELRCITELGVASYFLIFWDLMDFADRQKIPVEAGSGGAAGSLVAYALKITDIDPLRYGLCFEWFMNPERMFPPEINLDLCDRRQPEVIEYLQQKYGREQIAPFITFGTLSKPAAIRTIGRKLGVGKSEWERIAKLLPHNGRITLDQALALAPDLQQAYRTEETARRIIDLAKELEGTPRAVIPHPTGYIFGATRLTKIVPFERALLSGECVAQYPLAALDELGLFKLNLKRLKLLTLVQSCLARLPQTSALAHRNQIPMHDSKTLTLLTKGEVVGISLLEAGGMHELLQRMGIDSLETISALLALHRHGRQPLMDDFINRKHGTVKVEYLHPALEPILKETYGIFVYQEQVMQVAQSVAGCTRRETERLCLALGKQDSGEINNLRTGFIHGCVDSLQIAPAVAFRIFAALEKSAGLISKARSLSYSILVYQAAYLKANYPTEFVATLATNESGSPDGVFRSFLPERGFCAVDATYIPEKGEP